MRKTVIYLLAVISFLSASSCTAWFDNIPPYEATEEQLKGDNVIVGAFFPQLQRNVISTHNNQFQLSQNLVGDIYSGYMAPCNGFNSNKNNSTYYFQDNWLNSPFEKVYAQAMGAFLEIRKATGADESSSIYQMAKIILVASMHRFTDMWGPLPYVAVGSGSMSTPYDSQEDVYRQFFAELDKAVEVLGQFVAVNPDSRPMAEYDLVYGGDFSKWIKFANSLRLRLAMRVAYVDPVLAQAEAEKAVANPGGLIESNEDNAAVESLGANSVTNQLYTMWATYGDIRMGATIESYLKGYDDPRLSKMFSKVKIGANEGYFGIRTGIKITDKTSRQQFSCPNINEDSPIVWLNAAEVAFLKAEGALRGWNMGVDAKDAYERGVRLSFEEWGAGSADSYLADGTSRQANYVDPLSASYNISALSNITVKWNDADNKNAKLERIITQKWIALFPNGQEGWSEFRRTGYPKLFPVAVNESGGAVSTDVQVRRLPFARSEYTLNKENLDKAIEMLGGQDTGGVRLWWDVENKNMN